MSYDIDDSVVIVDQSLNSLVDFSSLGNVTTVDNYGFLKNSNTVTWAMNKNQPTTYEIRYPQPGLSNFQGFFTSNIDPSDFVGYFLEAPNMRIVRSNPAPGQYLSVRHAASSISGASLTNPFTIWVQPGIYTETDLTPITLPAGVFVSGFGVGETILVDHNFQVTENVASLGVFGMNNATFKRVNQSPSNVFLNVTSSQTLGIIIDAEFEDWKRLFTCSSTEGTVIKIGGIATSANSQVFPNMIANIVYTSSNTGSNIEINRSSFTLDSSETPFSVFGDPSVMSAGGFNLRNCSFKAQNFNNIDFINSTTFQKMILKSLDISGYSNILTISGEGLNVNSTLASFVFSDVISPDASILIQDNPAYTTSFGFSNILLGINMASIIGNKTDLNKIKLNHQFTRLPITNLDDCREFHFRDISINEDFTAPEYPYFDVPWSLQLTGTANISNLSPSLGIGSVVNGFGTFSVQSINDGILFSPSFTSWGFTSRFVQNLKLSSGITTTDAANTTLIIGISDSNNLTSVNVNNSATSNGIYFAYSPSTALYPSDFNCVYRANTSVVNVLDSGVSMSNGVYYNLDFEYKKTFPTSEIQFYINETKVADLTSNIVLNNQLYPMIKLFSNNGPGSWSVDYFDMSVRLNR